MCMCLSGASGCGYVHVCAAACRDRKSVSYFMDLELQAVVCFLMWVLGTKPKPSTSATKALNPWASSLAPTIVLKMNLHYGSQHEMILMF